MLPLAPLVYVAVPGQEVSVVFSGSDVTEDAILGETWRGILGGLEVCLVLGGLGVLISPCDPEQSVLTFPPHVIWALRGSWGWV